MARYRFRDGNPTDTRDVIVEECGNEHRHNPIKRISELHPSFMALQYPLLFPYGEDGFRLCIPLNVPTTAKRKYVSLREYYCFRLQNRIAEGKTLHKAGCLFHTYCVDAYGAVLDHDLDWDKRNQYTIRAELNNGFHDRVANGETNAESIGRTIEEYLSCRYISASESCWKLFGYEMHYRSIAVERLPFHEEGCNRVYFRDDDDVDDVIERNTEEWMPRKSGMSIGRIYYVSPSMGEKFYLRMLLNVIRGPRDWEEIRTVDEVVYPTYMATCRAWNLLGNDSEWIKAIRSASQWKLECFPYISEDVARNQRRLLQNEQVVFTDEEIRNYTLLELEKILNTTISR
ncbi:hypothetical protein CTI12_AA141090 [Artemisia annua]|uniref:Helitron helicase-like domain-containing protein n=1 Tax=Artemisia annua TaxID=35608 RepID=A0A2U1PKG8_ARTAN|nr:hypothetical protein CTI12_AA141090 [Artemisia annua]